MSSQETGTKFVHITEVIPFDEEKPTLTFPNLISVSSGAQQHDLDTISLRPMKRSRVISEDEVQISVELFGNTKEKEMVGSRGHHELNFDYFVGIRDKKTGSTKLIEVDGLYSLRPATRSGIDNMNFKDEEDGEEEKTYAEKRKELMQSFGGKKSLQRLNKYERDRITEENVEERMAESITKAAKAMRDRDTQQGITHNTEETTESLAPPHNNAATDPKDAYPLLGLVSAPEILTLHEEATAMIKLSEESSLLEDPGWHPLVWEFIQKIPASSGSNEEKIHRLQAIIHLHYLLTLANAPRRITSEVQNSLSNQMGVNDEDMQCLLQRFTSATDNRHIRTKSKSDSNRITTYAVIMWITVLGFKNCMRLGELSRALGINVSILLRAATNLGCKIRKQKDQSGPDTFAITLKVPLSFPRLKKKVYSKK